MIKERDQGKYFLKMEFGLVILRMDSPMDMVPGKDQMVRN
jgi:hypothetical protein